MLNTVPTGFFLLVSALGIIYFILSGNGIVPTYSAAQLGISVCMVMLVVRFIGGRK